MFDLDLIQDKTEKAYLKKMAIEDVLNFVGRSFSQTEFRVYDKEGLVKGDWHYKLNVRPNKTSSACDFWHKVIYKLIYENEVLIVLSDENDLLIADSFTRKEYAIYDDTFHDVKVGTFDFKRTFKMQDVLYLEYNNDKFKSFVDGIFEDLTDIYGRKIDVTMRDNQIRGTVQVDSSATLDDAKTEKLQTYINKVYESFSKNAVAIIPEPRGFSYKEVNQAVGAVGSKQATKEISELIDEFITIVAKAVGVPPGLIHTATADQSDSRSTYIEFCIKPLMKKVQGELNAKLFSQKESLEGCRIIVSGVDKPNIFELATSIDKLVSSGAFNRNEIRKEVGYDPIAHGDEFIITKNYQREDESLKGGE